MASIMYLILGFMMVGSALLTEARNTRASYGEFCNKTIRCNSGSWLSCHDGKCECSKPDEMIFDPFKKTCLVRAGERCRFSIGEAEDEHRFEVIRCVDGAECTPGTSVCSCSSGYYETLNGECMLKKSYLSLCNHSEECDEKELLTCTNNVCNCDQEKSVFELNPKRSDYNYRNGYSQPNLGRRCVSRPGKQCLDGYCIKNAVCNDEGNTKICRCSSGYTESDGDCFLGYGSKCSQSQSEKCGQGFNCVNGECRCKYRNKQYYDSAKGKCISRVHGTCDSGNECIINSECIPHGSYSKCICKAGYIETNDGFCDKDFGSPCAPNTFSSIRNVGFTEQCDRIASLECVNGVCNCDDNERIYDSGKRKCLQLVGSTCDPSNECTRNANCVQESLRHSYTCKCAAGYSTSNYRTCYKEDEDSTETLNVEDEEDIDTSPAIKPMQLNNTTNLTTMENYTFPP